jgi:apolipoprotein N-acyltransferase
VTRLSARYGGIIVLLAGALGVAAFAPLGWYPLAFLSLAILFNQWLSDTPRQALRHGALFGLGYFGAGVSWVFVSVHTYGHVAAPVAALVTAALVIYLSVYPALLGYCLTRFLAASALTLRLVGFAAGWIFSEWLRGWLFTGFPWLTVGSSQIDSALAGYAPVAGVYGTGLAAALTAALLVAAARQQKRLPALLALAVIWAGGYLLDRVEWTRVRGAPLTVALVQGNIAQQNKWAPGNLKNTLTRYMELTFDLPPTDLVVWPETAIPAFYDQMQDSLIPQLDAELRKTHTVLLTGIPVYDVATRRYYNAVVSLGEEHRFYYKQHLVPFGEYLPLREVIGDSLDALAVPNADFSSGGANQPLLIAHGYPVATSICFEVAFAEEIRRDMPQAALMVNVSNDGWFGNSLAPHQHLEMARLRAKETGRPMLRATNTGISAIIDHTGRVVARSPQFEEAVVSGTVTPRQGATPYVLLGNGPVVILTVLCVVGVGLARRTGPLSGETSSRSKSEK